MPHNPTCQVASERALLSREVEADESEVGGPEHGRRGGRSRISAAVGRHRPVTVPLVTTKVRS